MPGKVKLLKKPKRDFPGSKGMDNVLSKENTFSYKYSASENQEIQETAEWQENEGTR